MTAFRQFDENQKVGCITMHNGFGEETDVRLDRVIAVRNNKTVYRDGDRCIKVFCHDYSQADVLREALNQTAAEETGLHVPPVLEVIRIDGNWAIVSPFLRGQTLAQRMIEHPEKKEEWLSLMTDLHVQLHTKNSTALCSIRETVAERIRRAELSAPQKQALLLRLDELSVQSGLCHGDFMPSNIMITGDGVPFLLDWPCAGRGDPAADAACTYLLLSLKFQALDADEYLYAFCRRSGYHPEDVKNWIPLVAASRFLHGNQSEQAFGRQILKDHFSML